MKIKLLEINLTIFLNKMKIKYFLLLLINVLLKITFILFHIVFWMYCLNDVTIAFQHSFTLMICGPSQRGKTFWIYNLLLHFDAMIVPKIVKIVYLCTTYQPLYDKIKKLLKKRIYLRKKLRLFQKINEQMLVYKLTCFFMAWDEISLDEFIKKLNFPGYYNLTENVCVDFSYEKYKKTC